MKYEVAVFLILAAAVSAQWHHGSVGHSAVGHMSNGHHVAAGHHSRLGRSLVAAPVVVAPVGYGHVGLVGELIILLWLRIFTKRILNF